MRRRAMFGGIAIAISAVGANAQSSQYRYFIRVRRCDNSLDFFMNDTNIYHTAHDGDPSLDLRFEITDYLQPRIENKLKVLGNNHDRSPWAFHYQIMKLNRATNNEIVLIDVQAADGSVQPPGTKLTREHVIVKE